jgi:hypothetical protein
VEHRGGIFWRWGGFLEIRGDFMRTPKNRITIGIRPGVLMMEEGGRRRGGTLYSYFPRQPAGHLSQGDAGQRPLGSADVAQRRACEDDGVFGVKNEPKRLGEGVLDEMAIQDGDVQRAGPAEVDADEVEPTVGRARITLKRSHMRSVRKGFAYVPDHHNPRFLCLNCHKSVKCENVPGFCSEHKCGTRHITDPRRVQELGGAAVSPFRRSEQYELSRGHFSDAVRLGLRANQCGSHDGT